MKFAAALRGNPDTWAVVPNEYTSEGAAKTAALSIRRGKLKGFEPAGAYTTAVDGLTVYVKYVGPGED